MIQRFQIEDLVVQDNTGVVFRAVDTETGQTVALRRFFPFGPTGGGLNKEEQTAYDIAVKRLADVSHPALRAVICGACDPVDGMPFIATEWIEGDRLQSFIDNAPLSPAEAANLLSLALEVCQILSEMLEEEAIWVETSLEAIVVGTAESHRGFTFWISPLKWLGQHDGQHGLETIITLTEQVLGWEEQEISDQAGMGLGAWLNWLRVSVKTASLQEAREMLAKSFGADAPTPTRQLANPLQAKQPIIIRKKNQSSGILAVVIGTLIGTVLAGGGWAYIQWRNQNNPSPPLVSAQKPPAPALPDIPAPPVTRPSEEVIPAPQDPKEPLIPGESPEERAMRLAKQGIVTPKPPAKPKPKPKGPTPPAAPSPAGEILDYTKADLLIAQNGKPVIVEGTLMGFGLSQSGATLFLQFSAAPPASETRGSILLKDAPKDLAQDKLLPLKGKKIRLHGKVRVESAGTARRPVILIDNRAAIEEVK